MKNPIRKQQLRDIPEAIMRLKHAVYKKIAPLSAEVAVTPEPVTFEDRLDCAYHPISAGEKWGELWDCAWFHFRGMVPPEGAGKKIVLMLDVNGEGCLFDREGCPVRGITNVSSEFDTNLGRPGKRVVPFLETACGGETVDFWMDAGCNDLFGKYQGGGTVVQMDIAACDESIRGLYYDMLVLWELTDVLDTDSARYAHVLWSLYEAALCLTTITPETVAMARDAIREDLEKEGAAPSLHLHAIGHAHIDLAWLWPIRETIRKGARTFSTALELLDRYPDYVFGASQPQLFAWMKEKYPGLYSKIAQRVADGRIEPQGAMWVEADTNLTGGESLVRQCLYGKAFFQKEFGRDMRMLWLPDVFGYTASLPQILRKCGVEYFCTIKLSWNEYNQFPYHTFNWIGIDGSSVLTHMPPEGTYNSSASPAAIQKAEKNYAEKGLCEEALLLFGIGDGGGGPGPEHLEKLSRLKNAAGLCPVHQDAAVHFFDDIAAGRERYPRYRGELYLERHQGTFTTQARNKKYNRRMERLLHDVELLCTIRKVKTDATYPAEELETIWKEVLLYQFHDIIPGSSIRRVYDESLARYAVLEKRLHALLGDSAELSEAVAYNSLGWDRTAYVETDGRWRKLHVPALGVHPIEEVTPNGTCSMTEDTLSNAYLTVRFHENGEISSLYDKRAGREIAVDGQTLHQWRLYVDKGDAWDIPINYRQRPAEQPKMIGVSHRRTEVSVERIQEWVVGASRIRQHIILFEDKPYVDFRCTVDWQENGSMLRVDFPLNMQSDVCTCDIQFGHLKRSVCENTSLDYAQFEICAHKWVDVSDGGYGVSLLNDCKYGYRVKDGCISLDLLRSTQYPGTQADRGTHEFGYALYLHNRAFSECETERAAYEYNYPVTLLPETGFRGTLACVDALNVVIESVKMAEDGEGFILRLYENKGRETPYTLTLGVDAQRVWKTDLLEQKETEYPLAGSDIKDVIHPFEIQTFRIAL